MDKVAIVLLNYNGRDFLRKFLPFVLENSANHTIIVADNASTDDSLSVLKKEFPQVKTIVLNQNYGFAGGYNQALKAVKADYYVLLNSDVEVSPNWVNPVIDFMDATPSVAACQPKILAYNQRTHFEYAGAAGGVIDWLGYPFCRGRIFDTTEIDTGQYDTPTPIFWASGACLFIRSSVFHGMGGFDATFFAHMEEIDLCWRMQLAGHSLFYIPQSVIYHVGGGTLQKTNPKKTFLNFRNGLLMLYKNLPAKHLFWKILYRMVLDGISSIKFLMAGEFRNIWAIIQAHGAFYGCLLRGEVSRQPNPAALPNVYQKSIIWQYFVKGKKKFSELG